MRSTVIEFFVLCLGAVLVAGCGSGGGSVAAASTLMAVVPSQGPAAGGTRLTIAGTGFAADATVTVGASSATAVSVVDDTTIICSTPPGSSGAVVDVTVTSAGGTATLPSAFVYLVVPTLASVSPTGGSLSGGTLITLTGSGFDAGVSYVTVAGRAATDLQVGTDTSCTCRTPASLASGAADVAVTTAGGSATLLGGFAYRQPPTLMTVDPDSGFAVGGATVALTGTGFTANSAGLNTVRFGGASATNVITADDTTLSCRLAPSVPVGLVDVEVWNASGVGTLADGFTYFSFPPTFLASDLQLGTDTPGSADSADPQICCDGTNVYVVWSDSRNGEPDIYFNRSTDGGETWLSSDVRLDTDLAGASESEEPQICCDGTSVYVVWPDSRNGERDIYFNRTTDKGVTWLSNDVRLNTDTAGAASAGIPQICCDGTNVYVVWFDRRNGNGDTYFNRSTNQGATWLGSDVRLDTDTAGAAHSSAPKVCCDGANVYAVWWDWRNGPGDIHFNRSTNAGATWLTSDVRIDTDGLGAAGSRSPQICCEGSDVYVVWEERRHSAVGFSADVYFNRSADAGASWLGNDVRLNTDVAGMSDIAVPQICCDGTNVHVVWMDERIGRWDVYARRSTNGGASWIGNDVRIDTDVTGGVSMMPQVCCDGDVVQVVWTDGRENNLRAVYFSCSTDAGATWLSSDVRLDTSTPPAASGYPRVCGDGARSYVVWDDARNEVTYEIHFTATRP